MHSSVRVLMSLAVTIACARAALAQAPDQPFASYWFPNELLAWSPDSDPDAAFNRSNTPLATRFFNPDLNVNADRKSTRLNSSHSSISYAVFCLKKKKKKK